jgi:hypothetical protein
MSGFIIDARSVRDLAPDVMQSKGLPRVLPTSYYQQTTLQERAMLCVQNGLYCLPTDELITWLKEVIGPRKAIEIGAGNGVLGSALGITSTDNFLQDDPSVTAMYAEMRQPVVTYGKNFEKMDALQAIKVHKPSVVIASWVTHLYREDRQNHGGNMFGVSEEDVINGCDTYIFIGNNKVHAGKSIWKMPHTRIEPNWLFSRAFNGSADFIAVWEK